MPEFNSKFGNHNFFEVKNNSTGFEKYNNITPFLYIIFIIIIVIVVVVVIGAPGWLGQ